MQNSNCYLNLQIKQSNVQSVARGLCSKVGRAAVDFCGKTSSEVRFFDIPSTNKYFFHCCVISMSKYISYTML